MPTTGRVRARPPLWTCPACRRRFANRNQTHFCGRHTLTPHFAGKPPHIRATFRAFRDAVRAIGPVTVVPQKSRIAFQVRMAFAQLTPRTRSVDGHLVLARAVPAPCIRRIESLSRRNHVHHFRLTGPEDITADLRRLIAEAYEVGAQRRLT